MASIRHRASGPRDDKTVSDGDIGFKGVNDRLDPGLLEPFFCSVARNKRFTEGRAATRKGHRILRWANFMDTTENDLPVPLGNIVGATQYRDPSTGIVWVIVANSPTKGSLNIYQYHESSRGSIVGGTGATSVLGLPSDEWVDEVNFIQQINVLLMQITLSGGGFRVFQLTAIDEGFKPILAPSSGVAIPASDTGIAFGGRVFIPNGADPDTGIATRDIIWVSDIFEVDRGSIQNEMRVNQGDDEDLVGLYQFNETTLIAGKSNSIYGISNIVGTTLGSLIQDPLTTEFGLAAKNSFAQVGEEVWFLSNPRGVMSIYQVDANKLRVRPIPVSRDIEGTIKRINWRLASNAQAAFHDNKFYLAVPLGTPRLAVTATNVNATTYNFYVHEGQEYYWEKGDSTQTILQNGVQFLSVSGPFRAVSNLARLTVTSGSAVVGGVFMADYNNAVLVFDTETGAWAGYDEGESINVKRWLKVRYGGVEKLAYIGNDGMLRIYEDGPLDQMIDSIVDSGSNEVHTLRQASISDRFVSRGYGAGLPGFKHFNNLNLDLATWWPKYSIKVVTDGPGEEQAIETDTTRDRSKYQVYHKADWVLDNSNDDFNDPYREDYAIIHATAGATLSTGTNGLNPGLLAESTIECRTPAQRGRYMRIEVSNTQGRCEIITAGAEVREGQRRRGVLA